MSSNNIQDDVYLTLKGFAVGDGLMNLWDTVINYFI